MTNPTLGKWRNPPLAYVVAEIVIAPLYDIAASIPGIQKGLRSDYPRTLEGNEVTIESSGPPIVNQVWRLLSADQSRGVFVGTRSISLHSTHYLDSHEFLESWDGVLKVIEEVHLSAFVERIGLRYVDLIVPSEGRSPSDYVDDGVRGVRPSSQEVLLNSIWAGSFSSEGFTIGARVGAPSPPGMLLPPNFNALPLHKPPVWVAAEKEVLSNHQIGFVDTDCTAEIKELFSAPQIGARFRAAKTQISDMFERLTSDFAKGEWK